MLELLAISGLAFFLKNSELLSWFRSFLFRLHPLFFKLFSCMFCLGCHCGWIIYLISFRSFNVNIILYMFSGGVVSLLFDSIINSLNKD